MASMAVLGVWETGPWPGTTTAAAKPRSHSSASSQPRTDPLSASGMTPANTRSPV